MRTALTAGVDLFRRRQCLILSATRQSSSLVSQRVLEAPWPELVVAHTEVEWEHLPAGVERNESSGAGRASRQPSRPLLARRDGCPASTGLVATSATPKASTLFQCGAGKTGVADGAERRLRDVSRRTSYAKMIDSRDFDDFGTKTNKLSRCGSR